MRTLGKYIGANRSMNGDLQVTFAVDYDMKLVEELEALKETDIVIEAEKYREKRSLQANRYLWKLCDLIAKKLGSDKETIYIMKLKDYGVFNDYSVVIDALPQFERLWRYTEIQYRFTALRYDDLGNSIPCDMAEVRCWIGSHEYNTKQMSDMLTGVINDAMDIGVPVWPQEEIDSMVNAWKGV